MVYGYARCSTNEERQDIDRQKRELYSLGVTEDKYIYWEYESGTKTDRAVLQKCFLQALFGQNCKIFLDIVAKRFWTLLHVQIGQSCNAPAGCVINQP